ncbi:MAG: MFS transporter [Brevinematales bacterium]
MTDSIPAPALQKPFYLFLSARLSATLAYQMLAVTVGWQIYIITGSPFYLGLVGLAQFLPMFVLTLAVGHAADRYDRQAIVRICQVIEASGAAVLAAGSIGGWLTREHILIIMLILGSAHAFEGPTMQSLLPRLAPGEIFPRAAAWAASAFQTASIIGPAIGGVLLTLGPAESYSAIAVLYVLSSFLVSSIHTGKRPPKREPASFKSIFAGLSFIRSRPVILGAISLDLFAVLLGGATALLPVFAHDILKTGPWGLGFLRCAPAAGALVMSVILAQRPLRKRVGRTMFIAVIIFGLATIIFGLSRSFPLSLAALFILGAADVISVVIRSSLVQMKTPDSMRGRVNAVNSMFIGTSNQLGEFESGITASWFGTVPSVLIGGAGTIIVVAVWIFAFPGLAGADKLEK